MFDEPIQPLPDNAKRFAEEYLIDFKVGPAAERAGIPRSHAEHLLNDPRFIAYRKERARVASERVNISVDWVLNKLRIIADSNTVDYFRAEPVTDFFGRVALNADGTPKTHDVLDLSKLTDDQKEALKSVKWTNHGPAIETHDKVGALRDLGRYFAMFTDKQEVSGRGGKAIELITGTMTPEQAAALYQDTLKGSGS